MVFLAKLDLFGRKRHSHMDMSRSVFVKRLSLGFKNDTSPGFTHLFAISLGLRPGSVPGLHAGQIPPGGKGEGGRSFSPSVKPATSFKDIESF